MPNSTVNKNLRSLTAGERLWLARRRAGKTQKEMARKFRVTERRYNMVETGRDSSIIVGEASLGIIEGNDIRFVIWDCLSESFDDGELCAVARRRDGRGLRLLGKRLKVGSHVTLLAMERSADLRLVGAWKAQGYRF